MFDDQVTEDELRSVKKVALALDLFEPYPQTVLSKTELNRLVRSGLVESGPSCRPNVDATGYRLTPRGWRLTEANWGVAPTDLVA